MSAMLLEIRQALRGLLRSPGYSASVVLTLALGIAAAAAVFALIDGVLLRPLPYPDADRLILVREQNQDGDWNTSVADFRAIEEESESFAAVAAMRSMDVVLTGGEAQWVDARFVTAAFFEVMGVRAALGRAFLPGEDRPDATSVVVLGHAFAERRFGSGSDPVGQTLTLDGVAHTVVGVMPPGVERLPGMSADLWPALRLDAPTRRGPFLLSTVARLRTGATLDDARAELETISRRLFTVWQQDFRDETARLAPRLLKAAVVGDSGSFLWVALAAVAIVLTIAVVNVANLVLMRTTERLSDLAVRSALGATRKRIARFLITENLLLAAAGGLAGIALAALLLELYRGLGPDLPRLVEVGIDARVAFFVAAIILANGLLLGTFPLLFAGKGTLMHHEHGTATRRGQHLFRNGLVVLEFALTLPLIVAAGLLINSLAELRRVDPGFEPEHLLTAQVRLPEATYPDDRARAVLWERALSELRSLPGVRAAGIGAGVPPDNPWSFNNFDLVGRPAAQGKEPMSPWTPVTPGFFEALGVPLLEGRGFDLRDTPETAPVVVVSKAWAAHWFPGERAVGKQLYEGGDRTEPVTIVGVSGNVSFAGLDQPGETVFAPISQGWPSNPAWIYLRTGPEPLALAQPLRAALARLDPALVPAEVTSMQSRLDDSLGEERHWATVLAGFALLAALLSAVGVAGVLAYYVSRQRAEIGVRMALGADAHRVRSMVVRRGMGSALLGSALGIALAMLLTRGLESLLFRVGRMDPVTLAAACALTLCIALIACWLPARRASRVDPMAALRLE